MKRFFLIVLFSYSLNTLSAENCLRFLERTVENGRNVALWGGMIGSSILHYFAIDEISKNGLTTKYGIYSLGAISSFGVMACSLYSNRIIERLRTARENYELVQQPDPDNVDIQ